MVSISSSPDSAALVRFVIEETHNLFPSAEIEATNVNSCVHSGHHLVEIHPFLLNFGISL